MPTTIPRVAPLAPELDVPDELWRRVERLIPPDKALTGRPRADARACLAGICYCLRTGCAWRKLPAPARWASATRPAGDANATGPRRASGPRCTASCWRRWAGPAGSTRGASSPTARACARQGGAHCGPSPVDRAKRGCKRHVIVDARGVPLVVITTPGNVRDDAPVPAMLGRLAALRLRRGRRRRPRELYADRGYGFAHTIAQVRAARLTPRVAKRRTTAANGPAVAAAAAAHGSGLGRVRYVVERTLAGFNRWRRLRVCYERTGRAWQAFHELAMALMCLKRLVPSVRF